MGVVKLGAFLSTEWRQLFVQSLLKSLPGLNPDAADELSDSQFVVLASLTPEQAVRQYLATEASRRTTTRASRADKALLGERSSCAPLPRHLFGAGVDEVHRRR